MKYKFILGIACFIFYLTIACSTSYEDKYLDTDKLMEIALTKYHRTLTNLKDTPLLPRAIPPGEKQWITTDIYSWTSGFFPGILWFFYNYTGSQQWHDAARKWTLYLDPVKKMRKKNHDLGFMVYNSFGKGYHLTGDLYFRQVLMEVADSISSLYNPNVGTMISWPGGNKELGTSHNTIIDNMMNLELLFWAANHFNNTRYYHIAVSHANTTLQNHFKNDGFAYHVVLYDSITGDFIDGTTYQGFNKNSSWSRGQAWAIYGFSMVYRETGKIKFLEQAEDLATLFINNLPPDHVPYWDFQAPGIPDEPRDVSAAAIAASAFIELSGLTKNPQMKTLLHDEALKILRSLTKNYMAPDEVDALLLHSVGSKPHNSEVNYALIYADYYFIEALLREKKWQENHSPRANKEGL